MQSNFDVCFAYLLQHEGGFVNDPRDPGGITNLGVTIATWEQYTGRESNEAEMRALTPAIVAPLYRSAYWDKIGGDALPIGLDHAAFDFAVNSGVSRCARALQRVANVTDDGVIGPGSLQAIKRLDPLDAVQDLCNARLAFLKGLQTFDRFGNGWTRRINDVEIQAKAMMA